MGIFLLRFIFNDVELYGISIQELLSIGSMILGGLGLLIGIICILVKEFDEFFLFLFGGILFIAVGYGILIIPVEIFTFIWVFILAIGILSFCASILCSI